MHGPPCACIIGDGKEEPEFQSGETHPDSVSHAWQASTCAMQQSIIRCTGSRRFLTEN